MKLFGLEIQDQENLTVFLRELVQTRSPSTQERCVAERIAAELTQLGFRDVRIDRIGNVIGWVGPGRGPTLMFGAHMDTVQVSDPVGWTHEPFGATIEDGLLYGVGACDMKGGLAAMVYGAKMLSNQGSDLQGDIVVACVVQEEPSEGLGSRVLIEEEGIVPKWVVLGEPTNLDVCRGQRGRLEMRLVVHGRSAHAASPRLGDNAIYTAARLVFGLELLADQLGTDDFLGPGTLSVTSVSSHSSSRNAIPGRCELIIDRRLTLGENETMALSEIRRVIAREGVRAEVQIAEYEGTSYTGYAYHNRESYPAWVMPEDHPLVKATVQAVRIQLKRRPQVRHWDFSTEGVYTVGQAGISTVGFGPGDPHCAHTCDEYVRLSDVYRAAEIYAQLGSRLLGSG